MIGGRFFSQWSVKFIALDIAQQNFHSKASQEPCA